MRKFQVFYRHPAGKWLLVVSQISHALPGKTPLQGLIYDKIQVHLRAHLEVERLSPKKLDFPPNLGGFSLAVVHNLKKGSMRTGHKNNIYRLSLP